MYAKFYRELYRIRRVEEEIARVYPTDKVKSPVHLSIGQEAVSVGVCQALRPTDIVFGTYRSHALYLAKGGDLKKMIAELFGKATGCTKGKGGSMHLVDVQAGVMGASAVVGTSIPNAVGYAYAIRLRRQDTVVADFFGDGAVVEGVFHESMNFAALKRLPVLFICENNQYAIHARRDAHQLLDNIVEKARAYGMPAERIEGNDTLAIYEKAKQATEDIRAGRSGPIFLECMTYRWMEHVGPDQDYHRGYRAKAEAEPWMNNDQVTVIGQLVDPSTRQKIETEVEAEITEAFEFAEKSPFPELSEVYTDLFQESA